MGSFSLNGFEPALSDSNFSSSQVLQQSENTLLGALASALVLNFDFKELIESDDDGGIQV